MHRAPLKLGMLKGKNTHPSQFDVKTLAHAFWSTAVFQFWASSAHPTTLLNCWNLVLLHFFLTLVIFKLRFHPGQWVHVHGVYQQCQPKRKHHSRGNTSKNVEWNQRSWCNDGLWPRSLTKGLFHPPFHCEFASGRFDWEYGPLL